MGQTADESMRPYNEPFQYGSNIGYYGSYWTDDNLAAAGQKTGVHSVRPTLPEWFVEGYGYGVRATTFSRYVNEFGMKEITCFIEKPSEAHRDKTIYPGQTQESKLFARLYDPIWNSDGTVNSNNYYANYVYKLLQTYGNQVRFWEVVNEPDFSYIYDKNAWLTRAPTPAEQVNTRAPFYHYVRMLRITYEVVKKYRPDAYVTTGGLGYPQYVDALLRYTDNPNGGAKTAAYPRTGGAYFDVLSYHTYPAYALHYWDGAAGALRHRRTSDHAAAKLIEDKNAMAAVLAKYGYNGTLHPAKLFTLTESNISRRSSDGRIGSDEAQRNYGIKSLVLTQKNAIRQYYYFAIGENVDAPAVGTAVSGGMELGLMGLYENLNRATLTSTRQTQLGQAFKTTSQLLYGYKYDAGRTAALALPANVDGAAFSKEGTYVYVLWAKALVDQSEYASASYSFPSTLGLSNVQRYEWNYSSSGSKATQSTQGLTLSGSPSFFTGPTTTVVAAPITTTPTTPTTTTTTTTGSCSATGKLLREQWNNVDGSYVSSIPFGAAPHSTTTISQFESVTSEQTTPEFANYGARLRGYFCPPQSGAYTFYIAGDDQSELWLSTTDNPASKVRIASCTGWTSSARDYNRYPSQKSVAINLVQGQRYYIEARHKQGWGPGYVSVAMRLPSGTFEGPVAGSRLAPAATTTTSTLVAAPTTTSSLVASKPALSATEELATTTELTAFPNPFSQQATVQFRLAAAGPATLSVYDVRGQLVRQLFSGQGAAGAVQQVSLDGQGLSQGIYVLRLVTGQQVLTHKLLLTK
ncbi:T9SS type A sorting domain-containing protein [uncultured Hymenobacter sp.]|uniref:T9SS type A sorting domain-containing protein n=1 Tax=uncultured Hymenobacter sp. TaxID=170016 RepID=UPI0035C97DB0